MAGNRYVPTIFQALDINGDPLPNAELYFYENNTFTPKDTWSDVDLTNVNPWPVVADASGRFLDDIFLDTDPYRIRLTDKDGAQQWSKDDCNTFNGPASSGSFPFVGAVVEFYGTQPQLDVALSSFWYIFDGNNGLPNLDDTYIKACIDVASIGTTGGSTTPTGTVEDHTLTEAEMPAHIHLNGVADDNGQPFVYGTSTDDMPGNAVAIIGQSGGSATLQGETSSTGDDQGHNHTLTMNDFEVPFYQLIKLVYLGA